ncbi:MAG: ammonium transporter [Alphaproteobacteria bacterium]
MIYRYLSGATVAVALSLLSFPSLAADAALSGGDTAWILTSTALVLFMTLPGLAMFYGGLVRSNNVLSVLMHCFAIACLASIIWVVGGYALAFGDGGAAQAWIGGTEKWFLLGIGPDALSGSIPEILFVAFQMTFAIITPALIVGAYVERIKFSAVMMFSGLWLIFVYAPVCHWVWGGGWLADLGVMDFAGGIVVHVTAGSSALLLAKILGARRGFPKELRPPHNPGMTMIGAAMLWIGWFGFNAGSALAADGSASMAMLVTHISAATASITWAFLEWRRYGKASLVGIVTGMVAGLATITPASGFVGPMGALVIGLSAGVVCHFAVEWVKQKIQIDDSLDVFAVHGVGGALGTLLTAVFAAASLGGMGLAEGTTMGSQLGVQAIGVVAVLAWSVGVSFIIIKITSATMGLRITDEAEIEGLDLGSHGERGYDI